ncbi:MAG: YicC family protein [Pseudomonadota bacterium]|nr:YicC family protein [Pseudomonadota bacterium]
MINSMTAFARSQSSGDWGTVIWEIKSVNHRYLDVSMRLPEALRALEPLVREQIMTQLARGKVELFAKYNPGVAMTGQLHLNEALLTQFVQMTHKLDTALGRKAEFDAMRLLSWPGMVQEDSPDTEILQEHVLAALQEAVTSLMAMRRREGDSIKVMLQTRIDGIEEQVRIVRQILPEIASALRAQLLARLQELSSTYDVDRLEQELVYLAQKSDITEELDRLESHVTEVRRALAKGGAAGRRLDFLMQEFNREANTLGSKSTDSRVTAAAVELKVLIEQMREQVQNVE